MANKLDKYQSKRNFQKTKEPKGKVEETTTKLRFVVQHHLARKDHYDFRLEYQGVLKSWAVPKGPSYNSKDKRLAIMVEDHPLSYRNFEGIIPEGEYGAGSVMVWDEGYWYPTTKIKSNFKMKSFKFVLQGKRLKGSWTLVHFKDDNWLLIKEKDNVKGFKDITKLNTSIKSGKTFTEINNKTEEKITITSPEKVIFKNPKITKQDIFNYYDKVSKRMMPYLVNRIVSVVRKPEGYQGDTFFKKHLEQTNMGIGKITLPSKLHREDYYYIRTKAGLMQEVQMNSYEFHTWGSTIKDLNHPDIMVFDLDPDEALNKSKLKEGVLDVKNILDELGLKSYLKTSGHKGYHIIVPFKEKVTWAKARKISQDIAKLLEAKYPSKYTSNIRKNKRNNKIFIDWIRNTKGATSVAPYSIRLKEKCRVSMPISWRELDSIDPDAITMEEALKRLKKKDPWADFFTNLN